MLYPLSYGGKGLGPCGHLWDSGHPLQVHLNTVRERLERSTAVGRAGGWFPVARVHVKMRPDHGPGQGRNIEHDGAVLKDADNAGRLADTHGNRLRLLGNGRGRPVARSESLAESDPLGRSVQVHACSLGDAVPLNDEGAFELRDVHDLLADARIANGALG